MKTFVLALGLGLAGALSLVASTARAQSVESTQRNAFVVNLEPMIGILGGGTYYRVNPEFQLHQGPHYAGHALNLGLGFVPWFNENGPSFTLTGRWQYDHQLVPGTLFYVSPYAGLEAGLGVFDVFDTGNDVRFRFVTAPMVGLDVKLLLGRVLLAFRPIGITVPMFIGGSNVTVDVLYDISFSIGTTY